MLCFSCLVETSHKWPSTLSFVPSPKSNIDGLMTRQMNLYLILFWMFRTQITVQYCESGYSFYPTHSSLLVLTNGYRSTFTFKQNSLCVRLAIYHSLQERKHYFIPGGVLDQILDGDVPSRFQKHTRSLYQFFQDVYPTLYQFSENAYPILYQL